jgi:hypothetical protein
MATNLSLALSLSLLVHALIGDGLVHTHTNKEDKKCGRTKFPFTESASSMLICTTYINSLKHEVHLNKV